ANTTGMIGALSLELVSVVGMRKSLPGGLSRDSELFSDIGPTHPSFSQYVNGSLQLIALSANRFFY
ncbi:MAG: hypothetical protein ABL932_25580, partial [Terricaulis sp.]